MRPISVLVLVALSASFLGAQSPATSLFPVNIVQGRLEVEVTSIPVAAAPQPSDLIEIYLNSTGDCAATTTKPLPLMPGQNLSYDSGIPMTVLLIQPVQEGAKACARFVHPTAPAPGGADAQKAAVKDAVSISKSPDTEQAAEKDLPSSSCVRTPGDSTDYTLGCPRVWTYQRVYPFLDGIFQDVANTSLMPLVLSPNSANASNLNAQQTAVQVSGAFSPVTAAQNALLQQQTAAISTSNAAQTQLQNQLIQQEQSLYQSLATANATAANDNATYLALAQNTSTTAAQLTAAQGVVTGDNSIVTNLNSQLSSIKAQITAPAAAPSQTFSSPTLPTPSTSGLPTSFSAPPNAPGTPTFPASKQIDNQVNLLWERLSRLVATLSQADSLSNYQLVLASFNVDLLPLRRQKQNFAVEYVATGVGTSSNEACNAAGATIIDTFPNAASTNIVSTRYNDVRGGFSFIASFFSAGLSASLTRERLQLSQALGQSAYISGFGIGSNTFGWAFGKNLGEDVISPGNRTVFAIIAVPVGCKGIEVVPQKAGWFPDHGFWRDHGFLGDRSDVWYVTPKSHRFSHDPKAPNKFTFDACLDYSDTKLTMANISCYTKPTYIEGITYSPVEFDTTAPLSTPASIQLKLTTAIDPQLTVSLNGHILPRTRDAFGRAISGTGAGGNLETSLFAVNTWIPISSREITILVDPSLVERRFPDIALESPLRSAYVGNALVPGEIARVTGDPTVAAMVSGSRYVCSGLCISSMPPLAFRMSMVKQITVNRFENNSTGKNKIILSLPADSAASQAAAANAGLQVATASNNSPWGTRPVVQAEFATQVPAATGKAKPILVTLDCSSADIRLVCDYPVSSPNPLLAFNPRASFALQVHDPDHTGGPINALATVPPTENKPVVWSLRPPRWFASTPAGPLDTLVVCVSFTSPGSITTLTLNDGSGAYPIGTFHSLTALPAPPTKYCAPDTSGTEVFQLALPKTSFASLSDQMTIVADSGKPWSLLNLLSNAAPTIRTASDDFLRFTGINLVFPYIKVGANLVPLTCDPYGTSCVVSLPAAVKNFGDKSANIYFTATGPNDGPNPLLIPSYLSANSTLTPWQFAPPASSDGGKSDASKPGSTLTYNFQVSGGTAPAAAAPPAPAPAAAGAGATTPPPPTPATPPAPTPNNKAFTLTY